MTPLLSPLQGKAALLDEKSGDQSDVVSTSLIGCMMRLKSCM